MTTAVHEFMRNRVAKGLAAFFVIFAFALLARPLVAQPAAAPAPAAAAATEAAPGAAPATAAPDAAKAAATTDAGAYTPMAPTPGIGMPVDGGVDIQQQFSPIGRYAIGFHTALLWVMAAISVFVLALLLFVMFRFRASANPVPSRTTHNTLLEVVWTLLPVLVLVGIAIPSISLLSQQYRSPPKDALTVKATGYQWYWGYTYPDNGGFEVISNMLKEKEDVKAGERARTDVDGPSHLAVDNRMVVPAGVPIRLQTTGADVIHSFAVPSLWFKIDAVPGRLNERMLFIEKPGVYFGQCSELCGVRHGYMPIVVEALPMDKFRAWVRAQGGTFKEEEAAKAAAAAAAAPAAAAPAAASTATATPAAAAATTAPAAAKPAA